MSNVSFADAVEKHQKEKAQQKTASSTTKTEGGFAEAVKKHKAQKNAQVEANKNNPAKEVKLNATPSRTDVIKNDPMYTSGAERRRTNVDNRANVNSPKFDPNFKPSNGKFVTTPDTKSGVSTTVSPVSSSTGTASKGGRGGKFSDVNRKKQGGVERFRTNRDNRADPTHEKYDPDFVDRNEKNLVDIGSDEEFNDYVGGFTAAYEGYNDFLTYDVSKSSEDWLERYGSVYSDVERYSKKNLDRAIDYVSRNRGRFEDPDATIEQLRGVGTTFDSYMASMEDVVNRYSDPTELALGNYESYRYAYEATDDAGKAALDRYYTGWKPVQGDESERDARIKELETTLKNGAKLVADGEYVGNVMGGRTRYKSVELTAAEKAEAESELARLKREKDMARRAKAIDVEVADYARVLAASDGLTVTAEDTAASVLGKVDTLRKKARETADGEEQKSYTEAADRLLTMGIYAGKFSSEELRKIKAEYGERIAEFNNDVSSAFTSSGKDLGELLTELKEDNMGEYADRIYAAYNSGDTAELMRIRDELADGDNSKGYAYKLGAYIDVGAGLKTWNDRIEALKVLSGVAQNALYETKYEEKAAKLDRDTLRDFQRVGLYRVDGEHGSDDDIKQAAKDRLLSKGYTEEEIEAFGEYYSYLGDKEKTLKRMERWREMSDGFWGGTGHSILSVPANFAGGIAALGEYANALFYADSEKPLNIYSGAFTLTNYANTVRGNVGENLEEKYGKGASGFYGVAMSTVDSLFASLVAGGAGKVAGGISAATGVGNATAVASGVAKGVQTGLFHTAAMASTAIDITERGGSKVDALIGGFAAGTLEAVFEDFSIENFRALKTVNLKSIAKPKMRDVLGNFAKSVGVNFSEEFNTAFANAMFDHVVGSGFSQYSKDVQDYFTKGYTFEQAKSMAAKDSASDMVESGKSGALQGLLMAALGMGVPAAYRLTSDGKRKEYARSELAYNVGTHILSGGGASGVIDFAEHFVKSGEGSPEQVALTKHYLNEVKAQVKADKAGTGDLSDSKEYAKNVGALALSSGKENGAAFVNAWNAGWDIKEIGREQAVIDMGLQSEDENVRILAGKMEALRQQGKDTSAYDVGDLADKVKFSDEDLTYARAQRAYTNAVSQAKGTGVDVRANVARTSENVAESGKESARAETPLEKLQAGKTLTGKEVDALYADSEAKAEAIKFFGSDNKSPTKSEFRRMIADHNTPALNEQSGTAVNEQTNVQDVVSEPVREDLTNEVVSTPEESKVPEAEAVTRRAEGVQGEVATNATETTVRSAGSTGNSNAQASVQVGKAQGKAVPDAVGVKRTAKNKVVRMSGEDADIDVVSEAFEVYYVAGQNGTDVSELPDFDGFSAKQGAIAYDAGRQAAGQSNPTSEGTSAIGVENAPQANEAITQVVPASEAEDADADEEFDSFMEKRARSDERYGRIVPTEAESEFTSVPDGEVSDVTLAELLGDEFAEVTESLAKALGTDVAVVREIASNTKAVGSHTPGQVSIAEDAGERAIAGITDIAKEQLAFGVIIHEFTHEIKSKSQNAWELLEDIAVKQAIAENPNAIEDKREDLKRKGVNASNARVREEITTKAIERMVQDGSFPIDKLKKHLTESERNAFTRLLEKLVEKIKEALNALGITEKSDVEILYENWLLALDEARGNTQKNGEDGSVKYAFLKTDKGIRRYVSDFPSGMSDEEKIETFKERIATVFNLGQVSLNTDTKKIHIKGDKFTEQKNVFPGESETDETYMSRVDALYDYADILSTASFAGKSIEESYSNPSVPPKNQAHKDVKYWYYFKNKISIDGKGYDVIFNIRDKGKEQYQYFIDLKRKKAYDDSNTALYAPNTYGAPPASVPKTRPHHTPKDSISASGQKNNKENVNNLKNPTENHDYAFAHGTVDSIPVSSAISYNAIRGGGKGIPGELFTAAKSGDREAARELVRKVISVAGGEEYFAAIEERIGKIGEDVVFVPLVSDTSTNVLPEVFAQALSEHFGGEVYTGLKKVSMGEQKAKDATARQLSETRFTPGGEYLSGKKVILVDDVYKSGSTAEGFDTHVENSGGSVQGVVALSEANFSSGELNRITQKQIEAIERKIGRTNVQRVLKRLGIAERLEEISTEKANRILSNASLFDPQRELGGKDLNQLSYLLRDAEEGEVGLEFDSSEFDFEGYNGNDRAFPKSSKPYTESQYEDYGWAVNEFIKQGNAYDVLFENFEESLASNPDTEAIRVVATGHAPGINNVLVFMSGDVARPKIHAIVSLGTRDTGMIARATDTISKSGIPELESIAKTKKGWNMRYALPGDVKSFEEYRNGEVGTSQTSMFEEVAYDFPDGGVDNSEKVGYNRNGNETEGESNGRQLSVQTRNSAQLGRKQNLDTQDGRNEMGEMGSFQSGQQDTPHTKSIHRSGVSAEGFTDSGLTVKQFNIKQQHKQEGFDTEFYTKANYNGENMKDVFYTDNTIYLPAYETEEYITSENPDEDYVQYDAIALLKETTIDVYLRDYASKSSPDYAQAYIAYMSPSEYLELTTSGYSDRRKIEAESTNFEKERFVNAVLHQPIQLKINHDTGEVEGHEGRHRMVALSNEGIYDVPVLLFDSSNKYSKDTLNNIKLTGQFNKAHNVTIKEAIPLNYANRDLIVEKFGTMNARQKMNDRYGISKTLVYDFPDTTENLYQKALDKSGALPLGEGATEDNTRVPKKAGGENVGRFARTAIEAAENRFDRSLIEKHEKESGKKLDEEFKKSIINGEWKSVPVHLMSMVADKRKEVPKGKGLVTKADSYIDDFRHMDFTGSLDNYEKIAEGHALVQALMESGKFTEGMKVLTVLNSMYSHAGRVLQSARMLKYAPNEVKAFEFQTMVDEANRKLRKGASKKQALDMEAFEENIKKQQEAQGYLDDTVNDIDKADRLIGKYEKQLDEAKNKIKELENKIAEAEKELSDSKSERGKLEARLKELKADVSKQNSKIKRLEEKIDVLTGEKEKSGKQRATVTKKLDALTAKDKELRKALNKTPVVYTDKDMAKLLKAETPEETEAAIRELMRDFFDRRDVPWSEKWDAWRYTSMLSSVATHVRNISSNAAMRGVIEGKSGIKGLLEAIYSSLRDAHIRSEQKSGGELAPVMAAYERTTATALDVARLRRIKGEDGKSAYEYIKEFASDDWNGGTRDALKRMDKNGVIKAYKEYYRVFDNDLFEGARRLVSGTLDFEDDLFLGSAYKSLFTSYIAANYKGGNWESDTNLIDRAREYATGEGLKSVFRDSNKVATWLRSGSKASAVTGVLVGTYTPFAGTQLNIWRRIIEYNPLAFTASIYKLVRGLPSDKQIAVMDDPVKQKQAQIERNQAIADALDGVARSVMGATMAAFGYALASGFGGLLDIGLTFKFDDEEKEQRELMGEQEFSLRIGDHYYSYIWASPAAANLALGAALYEAVNKSKDEDGGYDFSKLLGGVAAAYVEPFFELSMFGDLMENFRESFGVNSYAQDEGALKGATRFVVNTLASLVAQAIPTFGSKATKALFGDTNVRRYQDDNKSFAASLIEPFVETVINKIGGVSSVTRDNEALNKWGYATYPYIDEWGRKKESNSVFGKENGDGGLWAIWDNMLSPGYASERNETAVDGELWRIYKSLGDNAVFPKVAGKTIDGKRLSARQYTDYAVARGEAAYNILDKALNDSDYLKLSDKDKAEFVRQTYLLADKLGRGSIFGDYESDDKVWSVAKGMDEGGMVDVIAYTVAKSHAQGLLPEGDVLDNKGKYGIIKGLDATDAVKAEIWKSDGNLAPKDTWLKVYNDVAVPGKELDTIDLIMVMRDGDIESGEKYDAIIESGLSVDARVAIWRQSELGTESREEAYNLVVDGAKLTDGMSMLKLFRDYPGKGYDLNAKIKESGGVISDMFGEKVSLSLTDAEVLNYNGRYRKSAIDAFKKLKNSPAWVKARGNDERAFLIQKVFGDVKDSVEFGLAEELINGGKTLIVKTSRGKAERLSPAMSRAYFKGLIADEGYAPSTSLTYTGPKEAVKFGGVVYSNLRKGEFDTKVYADYYVEFYARTFLEFMSKYKNGNAPSAKVMQGWRKQAKVKALRATDYVYSSKYDGIKFTSAVADRFD